MRTSSPKMYKDRFAAWKVTKNTKRRPSRKPVYEQNRPYAGGSVDRRARSQRAKSDITMAVVSPAFLPPDPSQAVVGTASLGSPVLHGDAGIGRRTQPAQRGTRKIDLLLPHHV